MSCLPPLRKTLQVKIVDDEEYEKKDNFFIELGQPQWLKRGISGKGKWGVCGRGEGSRTGGPLGAQLWALLQSNGSELLRKAISLSVCLSLSPALLLNQGEWRYYLALPRQRDTGGGVSKEGHGLKLCFQVRCEAGWR